jgi:hypothetical protein
MGGGGQQRGYQVIPLKDHEVTNHDDYNDEDAEEQTIYHHHHDESAETESLVGGGGNNSIRSSTPRRGPKNLSRESSLASSDDCPDLLGDESSHQLSKKSSAINDSNSDHHHDLAALAGDEEDDDDDDDEFNLRRYHNFARRPSYSDNRTAGGGIGNGIADQRNNGDGYYYFLTHLQHHWKELRQAAHQRRAARLLSMANPESTVNRATVCFISTCCDATDAGIVVAAVAIFLWIGVGVVLTITSAPYWSIGCVILLVRFTGRRLMEMTILRRQRRLSELGGEPPHHHQLHNININGAIGRYRHSNHGRLPPPII